MLNTKFKDKVVLVPGAAGSLDRAVAIRFSVRMDLTDEDSVQSMGRPG